MAVIPSSRGTAVQVRGAYDRSEACPQRRRQRYVVERCHFEKANSSPRITARRGGGVPKKMARSLLIDAAGVVFLVPSIGTPPRPRGDARRGISLLENVA